MCNKFRNFVSPHVHQQSLDSASTPEAFIKREIELGTGATTVTDHGSLAAVYKVYDLAKKNNLLYAPGAEIYFRSDDCPILEEHGIVKTDTVPKGIDKAQWAAEHPNGSFFDYNKYYHGTLNFRDFKAYKTAVKLLSRAAGRAERHGSELKPLFSWNDLEELAATNCTFGSGCLVGMVSRHLLNDSTGQAQKLAIATKYLERLHSMFKDRFYIEVFPHSCQYEWVEGVFIDVEKDDGQKETIKYYGNKRLRTDLIESISAEDLAAEFGKKEHKYLISVCNYRVWTDFEKPLKILKVEKKEAFVQNECAPFAPEGDMQWGANVFAMGMAKKYNIPILTSDDSHFATSESYIVQCSRLSQMGSWRFYGSYHRRTSEEAFQHFHAKHDVSEKTFESWVDNSYQWIEGFKGFEFESKPQLPTKFFPSNSLQYTKELILKHGRMPLSNPVYMERLQKELDILHRNDKIDLLPYFFVDEEVCRLYQNQGHISAPGRGSGAGLLLNYLLGITHVDPIKNNLSLERFINKARIEAKSLPDVDQDLSSRDLLVGYDTEVIEVEAADGTTHILPEGFMIETAEGLMSVEEAVARQVDFECWWNKENEPVNKDCVRKS